MNPRPLDVPVTGGQLRVGVWEPAPADAAVPPTALLVHGVTASHLAWAAVADALPEMRLIAPDLRGRGGSRDVRGAAGMAAHAADLAAVLDGLGVDRTLVVGHSMGAFVAVVLAHLYPERVSGLLLVDGGLPLDVPADVDPQAMIAQVLGPTATRLSLRFADLEEYLGFWRSHPAFARDWSPRLEEYLAYDLVPDDAGAFRPATAYSTVVDDSMDMYATDTVPVALAALRRPTRFVTVPRGLQDETPGLYAAERLPTLLAAHPHVEHERVDGFNHYTIVMSPAGAARVAALVRASVRPR